MNAHIDRLAKACKKIQEQNVVPYVQLRTWLADSSKRGDFERLFNRYYGLNAGGLTDKWKTRYFEILFSLDVSTTADPHTPILKDLYGYKRKKGDQVLAFSFVSKLVAIHDESRPLYDKHVSAFFGISPPKTGTNDFRIAGFLRNLDMIQTTYLEWSKDHDFIDVLNQMRQTYPCIASCHNGRLSDFLVWAVGHYKIG